MATVEINGKTKTISEEWISKNMKVLDITREEAIQMWLEDEGYSVNEEVEELTRKAKALPRKNASSGKERKKTTRERKPDEEKEKIIKILAEALENAGFHPEITNSAKIIEFSIKNNSYKVDLIKKRAKKS